MATRQPTVGQPYQAPSGISYRFRVAEDVAVTALVDAVLGRVETAVGRERLTVRVA